MSKNKINVYISSKHKLPSEKNNDFEIHFPSGLIKCNQKNEYMVMNINGFIMTNSFYNTQEVNNKFKIIVDNSIIHNFEIPIGNYNVIQLLEWFNSKISSLVKVEYDANLNKYKWTNDILINKKISIVSISANDFVGFDNNKVNVIESGQSIYSDTPINMSGDELILLSMPEIKQTYPSVDNFKKGKINDSSIVAYLPINVPAFGLMIYENRDSGDSFSYVIENTEIDHLRLQCFNQDMELINVGNYQLAIQFEVHKRKTILTVLNEILRMVSNIFAYIGRNEKI
tara:strand:+ start:1268 stop:2122 length:855 start_codon:yes stop_codon:yes gene_type:complete